MRISTLIIICITILLLTGIITYGIVINELSETPYEQCLHSCNYADKITCTRICTEEFREAIEVLTEKFVPLVEQIIEGENRECSQIIPQESK